MDFWKALHELQVEKQRLDQVIASLEALQGGGQPSAGRRGRKGMSDQERREVSERMRKYWASRRNGEGSRGASVSR